MNWLFWIVVAIIVFAAFDGFHKGMLRVAFRLVESIVAIIFVMWATPYVSDALVKYTNIDTKIEAKCNDYLHEYVNQKIDEKEQAGQDKADAAQAQLETMGVFLPKAMIDKIDGAITTTGAMTEDAIEQSGLYEGLSKELTELSMRGITFAVTLIITAILLGVISTFIKIIEKIPVIKGTNKILGLVVGAIMGVIIVWIGFSVVAFTSTMSLSASLLGFIRTNGFLTFLYQHNLVLTLLMLYL